MVLNTPAELSLFDLVMSRSDPPVVNLLRFLLKLICLNSKIYGIRYFVSLLIFSLLYTVACAVYTIATEIRDINALSNVLMPSVTFCLTASKLTNLLINEEVLKSIFEDVSNNLIKGCNRKQIQKIHSAGALSYILVRGLLMSIYVFICLYIYTNSFHSWLLGDGIQLPLPFSSRLIPVDGVVPFVINYLWQLLVIYSALISGTSGEGSLILSLLYLGAGLDVFADKVENFNNDDASTELRGLWEYHVILKSLMNKIERAYAFQISMHFIIFTGQICVSVYGLRGDTILVMGTMLMLTLTETLGICFLGQLVQNKSDTMLNQLYFLMWSEFSRADSRRLIIMMMASKDAMALKTPFASLTIRSFFQVLKAAYSLYALLQ